MLLSTINYTRVCWVLLLLFSGFFVGATVAREKTDNALIDFSSAATTVLLSFGEINPEFKDQDRTPLLRVYGDGRVLVHYPAYWKQAGEYEMYLSRAALSSLLLDVAAPVFGYNHVALKRQKKNTNLKRATQASTLSEVKVFYQSDAPVSVFTFNIKSYKPAGSPKQLANTAVAKIHWQGLVADAENYPKISMIQDFLRIENQLRALSQSTQLRKIGKLK